MNERATPSLDDVLARITVRGTDPDIVSDYAMGLIAVRSKRRRMVGGTAAVLVVAATTAFAVMGNSGPNTDEVVTPADSATSTVKPAGSDKVSATTTPALTVPSTTVAIVAAPTVATTTPGVIPLPTIPPPAPAPAPKIPVTPVPTIPVDRPGSGTLVVASGTAGELLELTFEFSDPDGPGGNPTISLSTDEPGTPLLPTDMTGPQGDCNGGSGTVARLHDRVQFASVGRRIVSVAVKYCEGPQRVFHTSVDVETPQFGDGDGAGWAVMAEIPDIGRALEYARWEFLADDGRVLRVDPPVEAVLHDLGSQNGFSNRGVVIVLPASTRHDPTTGKLLLTSDGTRYVGRVDPPSVPGGPATRVPMALSGALG